MRAQAAAHALGDELESWAARVRVHFNLRDPWVRRLMSHALSHPPECPLRPLASARKELFRGGGALTPGGLRGRRFEETDSDDSSSDALEEEEEEEQRASHAARHRGGQWPHRLPWPVEGQLCAAAPQVLIAMHAPCLLHCMPDACMW